MATIKAGTYIFVDSPTIANPKLFAKLTYKMYYLTGDNTYSASLQTGYRILSGYTFKETSELSRVTLSTASGSLTQFKMTECGETSGWVYHDYNDGDIWFAYTTTDTTKLRTIIVETDQTVADDFYTWFTANTTKQQLSIDLTTLPGWANLSSGNHTIKIKAKGTGYKESELSAGVTVSKAAVVTYENVTLEKVDTGGQTQGGSYVSTGRCRISNADKTKYYIVVVKQVDGLPYYTSSGYFYWDATSSTWKFTTPNNIYSFTRDGGVTLDFSVAPQGSEGAFEGWVDNCCVCVSSDSRPENADYDAIFAAYTKQSVAYYVCIIEGTLITLVDGTKKPVEDITYNDDILCWDFYKGELTSAKPAWITTPHVADCYNLCKFSNGAEVGFVGMGRTDGYHRIYNDEAKAFTHTGVPETPIGTTTFAEDGTFPKLVEQQVVKKEVKFYNIGTEKHFNLFTNGILTSSRISNCYKIKNMKYYGEQLISDEEIAEYIEKKRNY